MAKNIPNFGETLGVANVPVQWAHATVGFDTTCDVVVGDTATYVLFDVDEPIIVLEMYTQVATPFTTSVTLDIGDTSTLTLFTSDTTIVSATSGAILVAATGLAVPYVYAAAQDITVDVNGATVAAGLLNVYMKYVLARD